MKICVVGLGYVGLPLAYELGKAFDVVGFDIDTQRLNELRRCHDRTKELTDAQLSSVNLQYMDRLDGSVADVYIVTVPTPINAEKKPDLSPLISSCKQIASNLKQNDLIIFESTVYPGCTREICVPVLEKISGLKLDTGFTVGYSPERINPGDKINTIRKVKKLISASNKEGIQTLEKIYGAVVDVGLEVCASIEIAEAAKIIENTQRDVNIALMNEISSLFDKLNIPTLDVISAASTKWNFLEFYPGLVGGHCISVDPYYLIECADKSQIGLDIIKSSRNVNENIANRISAKVKEVYLSGFKKRNKCEFSVHIEGLTFKENCPDIRNSKIFDTIDALSDCGFNITVGDKWVPQIVKDDLIKSGYKFSDPRKVDLFIFVLGHDYMRTESFMKNVIDKITPNKGKIIDLKGILRGNETIQEYIFWEL